MSKLGYTWYPRDFASDPDVMLMTSSQRGIYRDLIDLAYQTQNCIKYSLEALSRYTNGDLQDIQEVLTLKGEKINDYWKIPSCDKRISIINRNKENGSNGGRPKNNPEYNPKITQIEPNSKGKEKEKEKEKSKVKESKEFIPPTIDEVRAFCMEKGYSSVLADKAFNHYDLGGWKDTNGNQVNNWKQKINTNWLKEEHKLTEIQVMSEQRKEYSKW